MRVSISVANAQLSNNMFPKRCEQASATVEDLLRALWHSEFLCHFDSYRIGIILLADIGLEFGMSRRCQQILDEIMPQVCLYDLSC